MSHEIFTLVKPARPPLSDFTHYASFYGIPCYWNDDTSELMGRNAFYDRLIIPATHVHEFFAALTGYFVAFDNGFPIKILGAIGQVDHEPDAAA